MSNLPVPPPRNKKVQQEFTGALLVSKEELEAAVETDPWMSKLRELILQDEAYLAGMKEELRAAQATAKRLRAYEKRVVDRLRNRKSQVLHFSKLLRKKLAWIKIKEAREKIDS